MPRNHNPGPSSLRNRNRVTNKTRLRIYRENIDADPLAFDEEEEKARVVSTAGVDAEDANEHHLQAVLSAASHRQHVSALRATRTAEDKARQDAYIPIPDSTGLVEGYEALYAPGRWKDPVSYIKTSETVEEAIQDGLAHGFSYFMDERDLEWLAKNNEGARGEGTSAQGAVSASGTTTRSGLAQRSAKARGKEPDVPQPAGMSEDEFELVMGLFEKVTHEKTEFLHHGLESGAPFPPFSDYQDTFAAPLPADTFAAYTVPPWVPAPPQMLRFAKVVYPYWKERRIERKGHRIIPTVNLDEQDAKNESYICFRRRDVKTMRKTRASQASSSEKLMRLQSELATAYEMARTMLVRETLKREAALQQLAVWNKREDMVKLKRKFPSLGVREDEELLYDKERVPKKPKLAEVTAARIGLKIKTREQGEGSPTIQPEIVQRPKERYEAIQRSIDRDMLRIREKDHGWEDALDSAFQPQPISFGQRHWKFIPPSPKQVSPSDSDDNVPKSHWRAMRLRRGRGGSVRVDRRNYGRRSTRVQDDEILRPPRASGGASSEQDGAEMKELSWRIRDRWRFDSDDEPPVGPEGPDEEHRVLVDEYDVKLLKNRMTFYRDDDHHKLLTDQNLYVNLSDGRQQVFTPFRLNPHPIVRRDNVYSSSTRPTPPPTSAQAANGQTQRQPAHQAGIPLSMPQTNGTPISQAQLKKMQPPVNHTQQRISSNGGMRLPVTPTIAPLQPVVPPRSGSQASPTHVSPTAHTNGQNGHAINGLEHESRPASSASVGHDGTVQVSGSPAPPSITSMPLKPPNPHHAMNMPNGYPMNNFNPALQHAHLSQMGNPSMQQQIANLKQAFNGTEMPVPVANGSHSSRPAAYMGHVTPNGANYLLNANGSLNMGAHMQQMAQAMNVKLPSARQMQWASAQAQPADATGSRRTPHLLSPQQGRASPATAPHGIAIAHSLSPHLHSPAPMQVQQASPPRPSQAPVPASSPSMQQQAAVGGSNAGY